MVKICEICEGLPVSARSTATTTQEMVEEGKRLAGFTPNVVVKLPAGVEGLAAAKTPAEDGAAMNMTPVFSAPQVLLAAWVGARCISPFAGRADNIGSDGVTSLEKIARYIHNYDLGHEREIIAASMRSPCHVMTAVFTDADIATVPLGALKNCIKHPLTAEGSARFEVDWEKVKNAQASVQIWQRCLERRNRTPALKEGTAPGHLERVRHLGG